MNKGQCGICETEKSKYCCPKCDIMYCSLSCYKDEKHLRCSEDFYKKEVLEELKSQNVDVDSKTEMMKILQKFDETNEFIDPLDEAVEDEEEDVEEDSDDEPEDDLADRIKGVNFDDADALWDKLTYEERQQFQNLVDSGEITELLPPSEPWYMNEEAQNMPEICAKIPEYTKLSSKPPADSIKFNLLNILAAYSYMQRYFLGDYNSFPDECCSCMFSLSKSLKQNNDIQDFETAVKAVFIEGMSNQFEVDSGMEARLVEDIRVIFKKKDYILASLSDILRLFKIKTTESKNGGKFSTKFQVNFTSKTLDRNSRSIVKRRLEYFLAYVNFNYDSELFGLVM